ncbi:hypothetical protein ACRAWF_12215 [Streptomyces sp. L7]
MAATDQPPLRRCAHRRQHLRSEHRGAWTRLIQDTSTYSWCAGGVDGITGPKTISCFEYENGISIW